MILLVCTYSRILRLHFTLKVTVIASSGEGIEKTKKIKLQVQHLTSTNQNVRASIQNPRWNQAAKIPNSYTPPPVGNTLQEE